MKFLPFCAPQASCLALCCAISPSLLAESPAESGSFEDEIVVISTRMPTPIAQQGTSVSVLTQADIEDQGYESLVEHLATQVGVAITRTGGYGSQTAVRIRGEESYRTRLYIDGLPVSDVSQPQAAPVWDDLSATALKRVEILRGPQGMLFGADAGGVVSVSSRDFSQGFGGDAGAKVGSDGFQRLSAAIGAGGEVGQFAVFGSTTETDGYNVFALDTTGESDGYENTTYHAKGQLNLGGGWSISAVGRQHDAENEFDNCSFGYVESNCVTESEMTAGLVSVDFNNDITRQGLSFSKSDISRDTFAPFSYSYEGEVERAVYLADFTIGEQLSIIYGVDHEQQATPAIERDQTGYHLALAQTIGEFNYHIGGRLDDNEEFGNIESYRAVANWTVAQTDAGQLQLKASAGNGFRAPSLYEQDYNAVWAPGSAPLKEEYSQGLDFGLQWFSDTGMRLAATVFKQSIEDEIIFDLLTYTYAQASGESESTGLELEAIVPVSDIVSIKSNYTYNDTETNTGDNRVRRPEHMANVGVVVTPMEALRVFANARIVNSAVGIDGEDLDDYELVDLSVRYAVSPQLELTLNIENLFDDDYQPARNYRVAGRQSYLGLQLNF